MITQKKLMTAVLSGTAIASALLINVASAQVVAVDKGGDITSICGNKPTKVALVDGFGSDTWRKIALAELQDEASKCSNITEVAYADAGGDAQTYASQINGFAAQGFNIIITFTDFGDAAIPVYRSAFEAGVTMVPYFAKLNGKEGVDYTVNPYQDSFEVGRIWGEWMNKALDGKGNVVVLGGPPGSDSSTTFMNGLKDSLKTHADLKLLDENYTVTNWNPADAQKAAIGLIAQYPQIDAMAADYGVPALGATRAFLQAGRPVPAVASIANPNEYACFWLDAKKNGKAWKWLGLDGSTANTRFALRAGMAKFQGFDLIEPLGVVPFVYVDSEAGIDPKCDPTAPPDAQLSSSLPPEKLKELFQQ